MSQAEIAGGKVSPKGEIPRTGYRLRDFLLKSTAGPEVHLSDYRGRSNLIVIFAGLAEPLPPVRDLAAQHRAIREEQTDVLLIVSTGAVEQTTSIQLPFPLLVDRNRQVHAEYGLERKADSIPAIFIADRFGELVASYVGSEIANATSASILKWLQFMNSQCPECEPPEWPLEE